MDASCCLLSFLAPALLPAIPSHAQAAPNGQAPPPAAVSSDVDVYDCHPGKEMICPKLIYAVVPEYGPAASRLKLRGVVTVSLIVGTDGLVHDVQVAKSIGEGLSSRYREAAAELDHNAVEAARRYRFKPGTLRGKPIQVAIKQDVQFELF